MTRVISTSPEGGQHTKPVLMIALATLLVSENVGHAPGAFR